MYFPHVDDFVSRFSVYSGHHTILIPPGDLETNPALWLSVVSQYKGNNCVRHSRAFWVVVRSLISQLKPKFNIAETEKPFHEFSFKHSSNFFLCVGYFSIKKASCLFLPRLSNLAVRNEFTELLFSTCSRYCWNYCHFIFPRSSFRPELNLSIKSIAKGKVTGIGIGNGRSCSTNRISFYCNVWMISL